MGSLDPNGQAFVELISEGLCRNCTVLAGKTRITFEDGTEAGPPQGIYIHHVISREITKPANLPVTKCGVGQKPQAGMPKMGGSEFLAQGDDSQTAGSILFTSKDGKYKSGYFIGPKFILMNQMDLVNLNPESKKVYVTYEIEYVDGHVGADASATLMSVTGCNQIPLGAPAPAPAPAAGHSDGKGGLKLGGIKLDPNGVAITESPKFQITKDAKIVAASEYRSLLCSIIDTY